MQLKPLAQRFMRSKVGNGLQTYFWHDHWTPFGPLIKLFDSDGPRTTSIPITATVGEACEGNGWKPRAPRSDAALSLQTHLTTIPIPSEVYEEDSLGWFVEGIDC